MKRVSLQVLSVVAIVGPLLWVSGAVAAAKRLEAVFGAEGLQALRWTGADVLQHGAPHVSRIILEKKWLGDGLNQCGFDKADVTEPEVRFDRENRVLTYDYPWGSVAFAYGVNPDRLELTTTIRNASDRTIKACCRHTGLFVVTFVSGRS